MARRLPPLVLVVVALAPTACQLPMFEGPQIQSPPSNFVMQPDTYQPRRMFPDRDLTFHTAWVHTDMGGVSLIYVNGHPGTSTLDDAMTARAGVMSAAIDPDTEFGEIEPLTIDGRRGWGWAESIHSERRGLEEVAYRAIVPYDSMTFEVTFLSGEPTLKSAAPDTLRAIVSSFGVGATTWNLPLIAIIAGGALFLGASLRSRSRAKTDRIRSIPLAKFETPSDREGGGTVLEIDEDATDPAPTARPSIPATPPAPPPPTPPATAPPAAAPNPTPPPATPPRPSGDPEGPDPTGG